MKLTKKSFVLLELLLLAVAVAFFCFPSLFFADKAFTVSNIESVSCITLTKGKVETVLNKNADGTWSINDRDLASPETVDALLDALSFMQVVYPVPKQQVEEIKQKLLTDGIKLTYYKNLLKHRYTFYLSDSLSYGRLGGKQQVYVLTMPDNNLALANCISAEPLFWRDKLICALMPNEIKSICVENQISPPESFKLSRSAAGEFKLYDITNSFEVEKFDTLKVKRYLTYFSELCFERFVTLSQQEFEQLTASPCAYKLTIESTEKQLDLEIYYMPESADKTDYFGRPLKYNRDRFYLRINGANEVAVARWIDFDLIVKNLHDFD